MKRQSHKSVMFLTRGGVIAALYTALTYLSFLLGLSSGVIQFRISEALCILPIFMPEAILGLTIGCFISNLVTGAFFWDIIFGSVATLIGATGAFLLRGISDKLKWIVTLPTILANAIIIPFVLIYAYGVPDGYFFLMFTVGVGEIVCAGIGGSLLYYTMKKSKFRPL